MRDVLLHFMAYKNYKDIYAVEDVLYIYAIFWSNKNINGYLIYYDKI